MKIDIAKTDTLNAMPDASIRRINLCDLNLYAGNFNDIAQWIISQCFRNEVTSPTIFSHINIHNYYLLLKNRCIKNELQHNAILLFDGICLKVATFIAGMGWHPDLNGNDLFPLIMEKGAVKQLRIYCLGAKLDVISRAVDKMRYQFPDIELAGFRPGYFTPTEESTIVQEINACKPDMLIIGMGFINQEQFALRHKSKLRVKVIWNVGGLFDTISGEKPRASSFIRKLRLEWLFRFFREPRRMWKRNVISAPYAFFYILMSIVINIIKDISDNSKTKDKRKFTSNIYDKQ